MMDFSIKEAETLCLKAARGAGYRWGLAEEAGFAAGWLIKRQLTDLSDFAAFLQWAQRRNCNESGPANPRGHWQSASGALCPIVTGAFLSDCHSQFRWPAPIITAAMAFPLLFVPFVASVSAASGRALLFRTNGFCALVNGHCLEFLQKSGSPGEILSRRTELAATDRLPQDNTPVVGRIGLCDVTIHQLNTIAARTYVPESDELKATGAGGQNVDDDT